MAVPCALVDHPDGAFFADLCEGCGVRDDGRNFAHEGLCKRCNASILGASTDELLSQPEVAGVVRLDGAQLFGENIEAALVVARVDFDRVVAHPRIEARAVVWLGRRHSEAAHDKSELHALSREVLAGKHWGSSGPHETADRKL